jgi:histidyl-tRNA synthetase
MCGGGRYDNLIKELGGSALPSVGFGMGVERLILVLESIGSLPAPPRPKVFVAYHGEALREEAFAIVRHLRAEGIAVVTDVDARSLKSQLRQADKSGAEFVAVLGEDEIASGTVSLKHMDSGDQRSVLRNELAGALG